jgi:hypothetical protein
MGLYVGRPVGVVVYVLGAVAAIALVASQASAEEKLHRTSRITSPEADNGSSTSDGHFRLAALGGVGFPRPLMIEGLLGVERALALGAEYGFMPQSSIADVDMTLWSLAGTARVFPFRGPFFLGLRGGHQRFGAAMTASLGSYGTITDTLTVDTWFITPRIGALWMWHSWLAFGIEAGIQIPVSSNVSNSLPTENLPNDPRVTSATRKLNALVDVLGNSVLPTFDLLRIGFVL